MARTIGLDIAGVDVVAEDISRPLHEQGGAVVEVNAGPSWRRLLRPWGGAACDRVAALHRAPRPAVRLDRAGGRQVQRFKEHGGWPALAFVSLDPA